MKNETLIPKRLPTENIILYNEQFRLNLVDNVHIIYNSPVQVQINNLFHYIYQPIQVQTDGLFYFFKYN